MPHATQILADLGAEVLKVEPPGGDPMRGYGEIFASVARGKRSIELDVRAEPGRVAHWSSRPRPTWCARAGVRVSWTDSDWGMTR